MRFVRLPEARTGCERRGCVGMSTRICTRLRALCVLNHLRARHRPWLPVRRQCPLGSRLIRREDGRVKKIRNKSLIFKREHRKIERRRVSRYEKRSYLRGLDRERLLGEAVDSRW